MNFKKLGWRSRLGVLLLLVLALSGVGLLLSAWQRNLAAQNKENLGQGNIDIDKLVAVIGVIRTSGLEDSYDYQIADINRDYNLPTFAFYIKSNETVKDLLGKCVQVIGIIDFDRKEDEYGRSAILPYKLNELGYSSCTPYYEVGEKYKAKHKQFTFRGVLRRNIRSYPYYSDDYTTEVASELLDEMGFKGRSQEFKLILHPETNKVWRQVEEHIDEEVLITGWANLNDPIDIGNFRLASIRPLIAVREVPLNLEAEQVSKVYKFGGFEYAPFLRGNLSVSTLGNKSGILYAKDGDTNWKIFTEIVELGESKNNPYILDYDDGKFYVLIVDTYGAGSGEGVGKVMSLVQGAKNWKLETCFAYVPENNYKEKISSDRNLLEVIQEDVANAVYSPEAEKHCSDFKLVQF